MSAWFNYDDQKQTKSTFYTKCNDTVLAKETQGKVYTV